MTDLEKLSSARLRCVIRNIAYMVKRTRYYKNRVLWGMVTDAFGVGSTTAIRLCEKAGLDPHQTIPIKN